MMVMSWRLGARPHRLSLPIGNGCSDEVGSLAGAWRVTLSMVHGPCAREVAACHIVTGANARDRGERAAPLPTWRKRKL